MITNSMLKEYDKSKEKIRDLTKNIFDVIKKQ